MASNQQPSILKIVKKLKKELAEIDMPIYPIKCFDKALMRAWYCNDWLTTESLDKSIDTYLEVMQRVQDERFARIEPYIDALIK